MAVQEGVRRIVKVLSVLAWSALFIAAVGSIVVLFGAAPGTSVFILGAGLLAFGILQGCGWVVAGFSGNPKGEDGLVRLADLWKSRRRPAGGIPPLPATDKKSWAAKAATWLLVAVAWAIGWTAVKNFNQPADPVRKVAEQLFKRPENQRIYVATFGPLQKSAAWQAAMKTAKNDGEAMAIGARYARLGTRRLPDPLLLQRARIYLTILERSDPAFCGKVAKGSGSVSENARIFQTLDALPPEQVQNWLTLSRTAIESELKGSPPVITLSDKQVSEALMLMTVNYTARQREDLVSFLQNPISTSDTKACEVAINLYRSALAAPQAQQPLVLRALVTD